jgi:D-threonate/D-erythronate kinase
MEVFCFADDLTGALEIGSKLARAGIAARVSTRALEDNGAVALVLDAETRHLGPEQARTRAREISAAASRVARIIYKKTDSTLRGNIGPELRGMLGVLPGEPIVYVPAYPEMGRTVREGRLFVDGVSVESSGFAADPLNPVNQGHIPTLLEPHVPVHAAATPDEIASVRGEIVCVVDGDTEDHVTRAAEVFCGSGLRLAAGPADFAARIALRIAGGSRLPVTIPSSIRTCLVVNGSLHRQSALQVETSAREWLPLCSPDTVARGLTSSPWLLLDTGRLVSSGLERAGEVGNIVRGVLNAVELDAMVVFGGDTAYGILTALGEPALHPLGDIVAGVPVSRIPRTAVSSATPQRERDLYLISKAGGFGPVDVLDSIREAVSRP